MVDFLKAFLGVLAFVWIFGSFAIAYAGGLPWYGTGFFIAIIWVGYVVVAKLAYDASNQ